MWRPGGLRPPGEACERCGALVAVLVRDASVLPVFSRPPASLGDSVTAEGSPPAKRFGSNIQEDYFVQKTRMNLTK